MNTHKRWSWRWAVVFAACVLLVSPVALAGSGTPAQQIEELRQTLNNLEQSAIAGIGEDDFQMARQWLDEAEERSNRGRRSGVEQRLRRVDHTLDLLRAQIATADLEQSIVRQHEAYEHLIEQMGNLKKDIKSLEQQREERKAELERVRNRD